jgi:Caenorhabditis protein of unknown function, DUF268
MSLSKRLKRLRYLPKFLSDKAEFKKAGGIITHDYPIYEDFKEQAGTATGHYFHQDLLVATFINQAKPIRHIDVGSRMDGFVAHVASYRDIEVLDVRPLKDTGHSQIKFMQANLMELNNSLIGICDSLSCLHALEHFGLGRYGDPVDPQGHLKGFNNFNKMLKSGGTLYISFPIGKSEVHFNAHRVFDPTEILGWSKNQFELVRFDYVDDKGDLHCNASLSTPPRLSYGCGIYTLRKIN